MGIQVKERFFRESCSRHVQTEQDWIDTYHYVMRDVSPSDDEYQTWEEWMFGFIEVVYDETTGTYEEI